MVHGPADVPLADQARLALPDGFGFIPQAEAANVMKSMGNTTGERFLGLIVPLAQAQRAQAQRAQAQAQAPALAQAQAQARNWLVSVEFDKAGYIKDDDARKWDAKALLQSLKEGTAAGNDRRAEQGIPAIEVTRWVEPPAYDSASHRLVWSAEARLRDGADPDPTINYNTYVLGREGYISLDLITTVSAVDTDKSAALQLLAAVQYNPDKGYGDFKSSTDKVAAYGLAALVAGVAAKKLGLIAVFGAFLVKFAKVFAIAGLAGGGGLWRWLKARAGRSGPSP